MVYLACSSTRPIPWTDLELHETLANTSRTVMNMRPVKMSQAIVYNINMWQILLLLLLQSNSSNLLKPKRAVWSEKWRNRKRAVPSTWTKCPWRRWPDPSWLPTVWTASPCTWAGRWCSRWIRKCSICRLNCWKWESCWWPIVSKRPETLWFVVWNKNESKVS